MKNHTGDNLYQCNSTIPIYEGKAEVEALYHENSDVHVIEEEVEVDEILYHKNSDFGNIFGGKVEVNETLYNGNRTYRPRSIEPDLLSHFF